MAPAAAPAEAVRAGGLALASVTRLPATMRTGSPSASSTAEEEAAEAEGT